MTRRRAWFFGLVALLALATVIALLMAYHGRAPRFLAAGWWLITFALGFQCGRQGGVAAAALLTGAATVAAVVLGGMVLALNGTLAKRYTDPWIALGILSGALVFGMLTGFVGALGSKVLARRGAAPSPRSAA